MAYVKTDNLGKITMDLPYANYIYELPLLSFGDIHGEFNLSLIFNRQMKQKGDNPFFIQPGYKLNVQKRIIFEEGIPVFLQEASGKCVALYGADGGPYAFDDDSHRMLRQTGNATKPYMVENADYSREYYNSSGMILAVVDKYDANNGDGNPILSFVYQSGKLAAIRYRNSKNIALTYSGENLVQIAFSGTNCVVNLRYPASNQITVTHYSGEVNTLICAPGSTEFTATAPSRSIRLMRSTKEMVIREYIGNDVVNTVEYAFPNTVTDASASFDQVEITNNEGVKTRIQYKNDTVMYAYEVTGSDVTFGNATPQKYYGNVQIYKTIDDMGIDDKYESNAEIVAETAYSAKHVRGYGAIGLNDGIPMQLIDTAGQVWGHNASSYANQTGYKGYYLLTGWVKKKVVSGTEHDSVDICISNRLETDLLDFKIGFIFDDQWQFFAYKFQMPADLVFAHPKNTNHAELRDLRLTFEPTTIEANGYTTHIGVSENVLICSDGVYAPINQARFYHGDTEVSSYGGVYFEDILKYKVNKVKGVNANEVYCNKCKKVIAVNGSDSYTMTYNGKSYNLDNCRLAVVQYTTNKAVITQIHDNRTTQTLTYKTFYKDGYNDVVLASRKMNSFLDMISETVEGVTTHYDRNSAGLLTCKDVVNFDYTINIDYDVQNQKIEVTDEFGKHTIYTLDTIWGGVKSISLPDGTIITDEHDDDMCALTKRIFGSTTGRSNSLTYSNGNLTGMETGSLNYEFSYANGKLSGVDKNDTRIEDHVYSGNTRTDSYYPDLSNAQYFTTARFDNYGKLLAIDGILENAYTVFPAFDNNGTMLTNINNSSALLGMSTDKVRGEVSRYRYDAKGKLLAKTVTGEAGFTDMISEEVLTYDGAGRLVHDSCVYDSSANKRIESTISYATEADSPLADNRVEAYSYAVNGSHIVSTQNLFDELKRVKEKAYSIGNQVYTQTMYYDRSRISNTSDTVGNNTRMSHYSYDECNRIIQVSTPDATTTYHYDSYSQLVREDNQALDATFVYEYNDIGNMISVAEYYYTAAGSEPTDMPLTIFYTYSADKLIGIGNTTISYNAMGCPTTYDGKTVSWSRGKISGMVDNTLSNRTCTYGYSYNAYGQRVSKNFSMAGSRPVTSGAVTYYNKKYYYDHAGRLVAESISKTCQDVGSSAEEIVFLYDESGIIGMRHIVNGTASTYYFQRNLLGDVVAIYDTSGTMVAKYLYDAWGNCTISSETTNTAVANANPIRYRGYYYDDDTGLYYCNARYYSPKWRRFISPDDTAYLDPESVNGLNLYCYCNNDPVNYADPSGYSAILITLGIMAIGGLIGAAVSATSSALVQLAINGEINWRSVGIAAASGFVSGAIAASPLGLPGQMIAGGIIGGASYVADCYVNDTAITLDGAILSIGMGVLSGWIGGPGANEKNVLTNSILQLKKTVAREARRANQMYAQKVITSMTSYVYNILATTTWGSSIRFAAGCGVANAVTTGYSNNRLFPGWPSWSF